jgi:hypothetical protein
MELAILLALAASFCTATSSVCQRLGARHLEAGGHQVRGFDPLAVLALGVWVLSRSDLITGHAAAQPGGPAGPAAERQLARRSSR